MYRHDKTLSLSFIAREVIGFFIISVVVIAMAWAFFLGL